MYLHQRKAGSEVNRTSGGQVRRPVSRTAFPNRRHRRPAAARRSAGKCREEDELAGVPPPLSECAVGGHTPDLPVDRRAHVTGRAFFLCTPDRCSATETTRARGCPRRVPIISPSSPTASTLAFVRRNITLHKRRDVCAGNRRNSFDFELFNLAFKEARQQWPLHTGEPDLFLIRHDGLNPARWKHDKI